MDKIANMPYNIQKVVVAGTMVASTKSPTELLLTPLAFVSELIMMTAVVAASISPDEVCEYASTIDNPRSSPNYGLAIANTVIKRAMEELDSITSKGV